MSTGVPRRIYPQLLFVLKSKFREVHVCLNTTFIWQFCKGIIYIKFSDTQYNIFNKMRCMQTINVTA